MRYVFRQFLDEALPHLRALHKGTKTLIWNVRWTLGYSIGGFTSARRAQR